MLISEAFLTGAANPDFSPIEPYQRRVPLHALSDLIDEAVSRFDSDREASDGWLAPRIFAALRLTPREAADRGLWQYLGLVAYPDYIRWRWSPRDGRKFNVDRFIGSDNDQAIWRLWRAADLFRNGSDYSVVRAALRNQDIPSTLMSLNVLHNRAIAISAVRYVEQSHLTGREMQALSKRLRAAAMTRSIDEIAPMPALADAATVQRWIAGVVRVDDLLGDEIPAPEEEPIAANVLASAYDLLTQIAPTRDASRADLRGVSYLLLRSNLESEWKDEESISYHYGANVQNHKRVRNGARAIIFRGSSQLPELIGVTTIETVEAVVGNGKNQEYVAKYSGYRAIDPPAQISRDARAALATLPNYNQRYSINYLSKEVYDQILASIGESGSDRADAVS